jgi:hypothetical protein
VQSCGNAQAAWLRKLLDPLGQNYTRTCYRIMNYNDFPHGNTYADGRFQIVFEVRYVIGMVDLERKSSSYCIRGAMRTF